MPDEAKKNQQKNRNDPKDQRKPRQRHAAGPVKGKTEASKVDKKKIEVCNVTVPQKLVFDEPGPDFYKNLKRETDDILKITEEANSKYKKKDIQSNWTKYEMPIESYEEIEEQENIGADYEKLIEAPLSIGGHFQFKHERSWDVDIGPSLYDKYFEIDMDNLFNSISTMPFYERSNIDKTVFSETDLLNMNNRATRYKQKYYKDKSFTTAEIERADKILTELRISESESNKKSVKEKEVQDNSDDSVDKDTDLESTGFDTVIHDITTVTKPSPNDNLKLTIENIATIIPPKTTRQIVESNEVLDDLLLNNDTKTHTQEKDIKSEKPPEETLKDTPLDKYKSQENPVIQSPEDLEKWLDDFLDG